MDLAGTRKQVKLAGTAGVRVEELSADRSVVKVANIRKVRLTCGI